MTAQIIPFPSRSIDADRLADVAERLKAAIPLPTSADMELDMLKYTCLTHPDYLRER